MNTKLIVALGIVGVLAVIMIGMVAVSAQVATSTPSPNGTTTNGASTGGFFGWMGRCLGFRSSSYYGTGTSNGNGNGYGGCMGGFIHKTPLSFLKLYFSCFLDE